MNRERKVLDYSSGSLVIEVDSGNDAYCPTRHPIYRKREISVWELTNYHEPTEFYFTSEAISEMSEYGLTIHENKWRSDWS